MNAKAETMPTKAPRKPRTSIVADAASAAAGKIPIAASVAVEAVAEAISDTRAAAIPAAPNQKDKTMADTVKNWTAQGEQLVSDLKTRAANTVAKGKAYFSDANDFGKGNIEALVESGKIAAKGFEKLGQDAADYTRRSFEHTTAAFKGMAAVKSPTELMKLQSEFVRASFDMFVAEASRSTETSLKLAGEIAQPLSNRFAVAAEKAKLAA